MECWICKRPAHAICIFCGKAVCQEHAQFKPSIKAVFKDNNEDLQAIVVDGGVWCGKCKPVEYPVNISNFDPAKYAKSTDEDTESAENKEESEQPDSES